MSFFSVKPFLKLKLVCFLNWMPSWNTWNRAFIHWIAIICVQPITAWYYEICKHLCGTISIHGIGILTSKEFVYFTPKTPSHNKPFKHVKNAWYLLSWSILSGFFITANVNRKNMRARVLKIPMFIFGLRVLLRFIDFNTRMYCLILSQLFYIKFQTFF